MSRPRSPASLARADSYACTGAPRMKPHAAEAEAEARARSRPTPKTKAAPTLSGERRFSGKARSLADRLSAKPTYFRILVTRPAPTVRPPSRIAKRRPSSMATGWISFTEMLVLSPGITISVPSGSVTTPVTSVVRK